MRDEVVEKEGGEDESRDGGGPGRRGKDGDASDREEEAEDARRDAMPLRPHRLLARRDPGRRADDHAQQLEFLSARGLSLAPSGGAAGGELSEQRGGGGGRFIRHHQSTRTSKDGRGRVGGRKEGNLGLSSSRI